MTQPDRTPSRPQPGGAAAESLDASVAVLSTRLDSLIASWEAGIEALRTPALAVPGTVRRAPGDVLAELEHELSALNQQCAEHRRSAAAEAQAAGEWGARAMSAVATGRDDLARHALTRHRAHAAAAEQAAGEASALEAVRDTYQHAVTALKIAMRLLPDETPRAAI